MQDLGAKLTKESTKTHFPRRLVCCPRKAISNSLLAKGVVQHSQRRMTGWWDPFHARSAFPSTGSITLVFSCYWWLLEEHIENVLSERVCSAVICVDCQNCEKGYEDPGGTNETRTLRSLQHAQSLEMLPQISTFSSTVLMPLSSIVVRVVYDPKYIDVSTFLRT